uniref:Uncharacterized protein n=1 Tax=Siphoviridae sp. ctxfQ4 TaxID=2826521 RepID=A0A8S5N664_9CAUD|nr:MAG TPA: hypothetical protein [Siphoviridae sp. ctxfQ4]
MYGYQYSKQLSRLNHYSADDKIAAFRRASSKLAAAASMDW